jgi:predicted component of type VI protein secretion system
VRAAERRLAELAAAASEPTQSAATRLLWLSDGAQIRYALQGDWMLVRIGRASDNDLVIPQARVSRYHAQLRRVETTWLVYDLGSTNGTFVNAERLEPERPRGLPVPGTLRLGDFDLRVSPDASE